MNENTQLQNSDEDEVKFTLSLTHDERNVFVDFVNECAENIHEIDGHFINYLSSTLLTEGEVDEIDALTEIYETDLREKLKDTPLDEESIKKSITDFRTETISTKLNEIYIDNLNHYQRLFKDLANNFMNVEEEEGKYSLTIDENIFDALNSYTNRVFQKLLKQKSTDEYRNLLGDISLKMMDIILSAN